MMFYGKQWAARKFSMAVDHYLGRTPKYRRRITELFSIYQYNNVTVINKYIVLPKPGTSE